VVLDRLANLQQQTLGLVIRLAHGHCGLGRFQCGMRFGAEQHVQRHAGQGGDLLAARLHTAAGHHRARIPHQYRAGIKYIVDRGHALMQEGQRRWSLFGHAFGVSVAKDGGSGAQASALAVLYPVGPASLVRPGVER